MNFTGVLLGLYMLAVIGLGFVWVIQLEYHIGAHIWKGVLLAGLLVSLASGLLSSFWASALAGILGGSILWGATELPDQEERVRRGLFPANPRKQHRSGISSSQGGGRP